LAFGALRWTANTGAAFKVPVETNCTHALDAAAFASGVIPSLAFRAVRLWGADTLAKVIVPELSSFAGAWVSTSAFAGGVVPHSWLRSETGAVLGCALATFCDVVPTLAWWARLWEWDAFATLWGEIETGWADFLDADAATACGIANKSLEDISILTSNWLASALVIVNGPCLTGWASCWVRAALTTSSVPVLTVFARLLIAFACAGFEVEEVRGLSRVLH
jgi:hypothetical protein